MTEYWKSYAKKFCEICKCWYADNRVSIERHAQSLRHKAMVQQRIRDSSKKARDREVEDHDLKMTLYAMEVAARASLNSRDQREVPTVAEPASSVRKSVQSDEPDPRAELREQKRKLKELKKKSQKSQCWVDEEDESGDKSGSGKTAEWVEAETADAQRYYWHIFSGETRWDQPDAFYTAAEYADRYADIAAEAATGDHFSAKSVAEAASSTSSFAEQQYYSSSSALIDPQFLPQLTSAQVDNQIALSVKAEPEHEHFGIEEPPPPKKSYYGRRERERDGNGRDEKGRDEKGRNEASSGRREFGGRAAEGRGGGGRWEKKPMKKEEEELPAELSREERRKIRRERKAMAEATEPSVPEGLVELKTEPTPEQQKHFESMPKQQHQHPLGPWMPVKREEPPRPDIAALEAEMASAQAQQTDQQQNTAAGHARRRYDDLPAQEYGPGHSVYAQTPAELLEVAEIDPTDLEFGAKSAGAAVAPKLAKRGAKQIGFRKLGAGAANKQFRAKPPTAN